ncbi:hypothetical protein BH11ARM1_BH11ARM1_17360 [soil metagenome]
MKKLALLIVLPAVVSVACAQAKPTKAPVTPKTITCAVMPKDTVNIADATKKKMYSDYKGRRYFFCCMGCPESFKKDPAKYAKSASIPTPKPMKKPAPAKAAAAK